MERMVITPIDNSTLLFENINGDVEFIENNKRKKKLFDTFAKTKIGKIKHDKKTNALNIIIENNCILTIREYSMIKRKSYFKELKDIIRKYNLNLLMNKVSKKVDVKKLVCAGSLVTAITVVNAESTKTNLIDNDAYANSQIETNIENEVYELEFDFDEEFDDDFYEQKWEQDMKFGMTETMEAVEVLTPEEILDINSLNNQEQPTKESIEEVPVVQISASENEMELNKNVEYFTNENSLEIEPSILVGNKKEPVTNNNENELFNQILNDGEQTNITNVVSENVNFDDLQYATSYDDYIRFAANMYYVDYETAKKAVEQNMISFNTPSQNVSGSATTELNRMKDLKERGIINGDMNIIGIFISIKDYAIDNLNLTEQTPIISNKTSEERERDLIGVAKYVYGIDNKDILSTIIAVHRIETGYGTAKITTEKNNLGGNINPKSDYNHPVPNVYKTTEIGAESAVRNFLNVYDKCIYDPISNQATTIPEFLCRAYCPHTADLWKNDVTNKIISDNIPNTIDYYLGENTRTY